MLIRIALALFAARLAVAAVSYAYDDAGRLTKVDYGNGATITYTYDNAGNLLSRTVTSGSASSSKVQQQKEKPAAKTGKS